MKIKKFQKRLMEKKLDGALLFFKDPNFFYFVQQKVDNSLLLIPSKGEPILLVSKLENVETFMKKIIYENPYNDLKKLLADLKIRVVGINESNITVRQKKKLSRIVKTRDIEPILTNLRKIKTKEEISKIRKACSLTEKIMKKIVKNFNFKYEADVRNFIKIEALKNSCELSFNPIVASGKNASLPHYAGNKKIKKGFFVIDLGLKYKGYCADITRTFYIGNPSEEELKHYNEVLKIQKNIIKKVNPGVKVKELEEYVRKELGSKEKHFIHSLGHGLGIKVHEAPTISVKSKEKLEERMIITIEPGIYHDFGIRIEDDVLVTSKGSRLLTKFPKELIIIPKV